MEPRRGSQSTWKWCTASIPSTASIGFPRHDHEQLACHLVVGLWDHSDRDLLGPTGLPPEKPMRIYAEGDGWLILQGEADRLHQLRRLALETVHVVTDPPYAIGLDYGDVPDDWRPDRAFWSYLHQHVGPNSTLHMTVSNKHLPEWLREVELGGWCYLHTSVYWNKGRAGGNANGQFAYAWEPLLSFSKSGTITLAQRMLSDVFQHRGKRTTDHPAERDLGCWRSFMVHLPPGVILDPFMGSGTTLRAALDLGREAIGIERNEAFCRQASLRCSQLQLFDTSAMSIPVTVPGELMEGE